MLSLQLLLCLFSVAVGLDILPSTMLTSSDGMNVSGKEPFCLLTDRVESTRSTANASDSGTNNRTSSLVQIINSFTRPLNGNNQGKVLPNCYNHSVNVTLSTILSDAMNNDYSETLGIPTMYIGRTYEVVFSISMNLLPFLETNGSSPSSTTTTTTSQSFLPNETQVAVRFFLCNALVLGLCDSILSGENGTLSVDNQQLGNIPPYQEGSVIQGTKNGPHIESSWIALTLPQQPQEQPPAKLVASNTSLSDSGSSSNTAIQPIYATQVNLTFRSSNKSDAGAYFMLVRTSAAFRIDSNDNETILRQLDVASSLSPTAFALTNPPTIFLVSTGMKIYVGVLVGVVGALVLAAFVFIVYHRQHPVMKLSQGPFLAAIAGAIFIQVAFSFTELPTRNIFCILRGPMVLLPMEFVSVVILARTWRLHVTLSAVATLGKMTADKETKPRWLSSHFCEECYVSFLSHLARLPLMLCNKSEPSHSPRGSIRSSASAQETWCLVAILTLPQFFLQVVGVSIYRPTLMLVVDDDAGVGRYMCNKQAQWVNAVGIALVTVATVAAVSMSWVSRKLPTAFNEKEQVFNSAALNAMVAFVTLALSEMMTQPDIRPAVPVFLLTLFSVVTGLITLVILVLPKIRRVMSGEKVVISALLGARFSSYGNAHLKSNVNHHNESFKITINEDDPIPSWMSSHIMDLQDTLQRISDRCNDGRSLLRSDWLRLDKDSRALVADLDRVDFSFLTVEEEVKVPTQTETVVVNSSE